MTRRRICVVTGTRAEYGHMKWLLQELHTDPAVELQVVAAAAHLSSHHGHTIDEIMADGLTVAARVEMLLAGDSPVAMAKSMGLGVIGFADAFTALRPDLLVLIGDRYESLAAAEAAMCLRIPIAHISGGETTEGAIDEAIRHSLTKMSHLHFVSAEAYRDRVIQLGEAPERVVNSGAPGLDHLLRTEFMERDELSRSLGMELADPLLLVTYHPVTLDDGDQTEPVKECLAALDDIAGATMVVTGVNADAGGSAIERVFRDFAAQRPGRAGVFTSLGYRRYLSLMRLASAVVGNSSSGIIEAPALHVPTVNIGPRQRGRLRAESVIDCAPDRAAIAAAMARALTPDFQKLARTSRSPLGQGGASAAIARALRDWPLDGLLMKSFHDLPAIAGAPRS